MYGFFDYYLSLCCFDDNISEGVQIVQHVLGVVEVGFEAEPQGTKRGGVSLFLVNARELRFDVGHGA